MLLVGVGTGLDLALLPPGVTGLGVDLSPSMLMHARRRVPDTVELRCGDAAKLEVPTGSFDAAVLNLVLSVVPDPVAVLRETLRALRPGGRAVAFDKFAPEGRSASATRRAVNALSTIFGTTIDRRLNDIIANQVCQVVSNEPSIFGGQYRVVLLHRTDEPWTASQ